MEGDLTARELEKTENQLGEEMYVLESSELQGYMPEEVSGEVRVVKKDDGYIAHTDQGAVYMDESVEDILDGELEATEETVEDVPSVGYDAAVDVGNETSDEDVPSVGYDAANVQEASDDIDSADIPKGEIH